MVVTICALVIGAVVLAGCGSNNDPNHSSPNQALNGTGDIPTGATANAKNKPVPQDKGDSNKDSNEISKEPPPVQILTGNDTGIHVNKATVIVAQTKAQRKAMLKRHFSDKSVPKDPVSGTNFADRQVVGLFLPKQKGGTLVAITDVHQEGDHIVVQAVRLTNGDNCHAKGHPRPFHLVETRKMDVKGTPVIKIETQQASPC